MKTVIRYWALGWILAAAVVVLCSAHGDEVLQEDKRLQDDLFHLPGKEGVTFYLKTPSDYDPETKYPLIVSLHGAGEKGDRMLRYWKKSAARFGMIVLCPNSNANGWDQDSVMNILHIMDYVIQQYSVQRERILLSGISAGGTITYWMGLAGTDMFPYLNPMSTVFQERFLPLLDSAKKIPIYITHGGLDRQISPEAGGEHAAKILEDRGFDVRFVLRPEDGHELPEGEQENILRWFQQKADITPQPKDAN